MMKRKAGVEDLHNGKKLEWRICMMKRKAGLEDLHDEKRRLKTAYTLKTNN